MNLIDDEDERRTRTIGDRFLPPLLGGEGRVKANFLLPL